MSVDFLILGATGMQGSIVARDLVESGFTVVASGRSEEKLKKLQQGLPHLRIQPVNLQVEEDLARCLLELQPKVLINCAEGDWNLAVYQHALKNGCHVLDLGSEIPMTKQQLALHSEFQERGLTAITGCGSTPGVNNVMLDYAVQQLDTIQSIEAGFAWNSNIKQFVVPFSMESIVEEFLDPADVVLNGVWVKKQPLDSVHEREFRQVGLQKVFYVRHPEPYTFYESYKQKGVQDVLYFAGFPTHSFETIQHYLPTSEQKKRMVTVVDGKEVPLNQLTQVLQGKYPAPIGYEEVENLWVIVEGKKDGRTHRVLMECIVSTLPDWKEAGCNIDTSFPMAIMAEMILKQVIAQRGSFAPEQVVPHHEFFHALNRRGMSVWMNGEEIGKTEHHYSHGEQIG